MIKAIIFDCFGVLTIDNWPALYANYDSATRQKVERLTKNYDLGLIPTKSFISEISKILRVDDSLVSAAESPINVKNSELLEYISTLKSQNLRIGLLSNINNNWVRETLLSDDEQNLFDAMVLSYEVAMVKPNPEIFTLTAAKLGVATDECVFVDDNIINCEAAVQLNMVAIHFKNFKKFKDDLEPHLLDS